MRAPRLSLLLLCLLCWPAVAPLMAATPRYVVGVENIDYRPFQAGHAGVFEGFGRELLDAFAAAEGIELTYRPLPPPRLLASLLQDRIDFKYPDDPAWRADLREGHAIRYSRPVVGYLDGTLVLPAHLGRPATAIRTLGTVVGFTPIAWLEPLRAGRVMLRENADFDALFQQVLSQRLDAAYANVAVAREQSRRILGRPDALGFDPSLPSTRGDYRLSTVRHPELLQRFDAWLDGQAALVNGLKRRAGLTESE
ncbi:transporter substrate-binding domain-containing protein [Thiocystis violacea]|uniref:transporter substrate-binding domain-containing protein n=1 Tax=Thiocystis violacea TaxID=13725 RepID=UPI001902DEE3|nr:transporter substrate-binding domain-containing protein [Thiocystis violacea]MBK1724128.1 ABC transporter substrate-binding protein [Thiocystis violacea]